MTDLAVAPTSTANRFINEWERQQGEPAKAFSAFTIFRDMGDERGVTLVRDKAGGAYSHKSLMTWAEKYRWIERADAYDRYLDRRRQAALAAEIEAQARRQVQAGQVLQEHGLKYVKENLATPEERKANLSANTALRFIDKGIDLERQGLGADKPDVGSAADQTPAVLDAGTKADVFAKIDEMSRNMKAWREAAEARGMAFPPEEIIDVEGEEVEPDVDAEDADSIFP